MEYIFVALVVLGLGYLIYRNWPTTVVLYDDFAKQENLIKTDVTAVKADLSGTATQVEKVI